MTTESLSQLLHNRQISHAETDGKRRLTIHFSDGSVLTVEARSEELVVNLKQTESASHEGASAQPTKRQFEYLTFIAKYIARFGRSPAESDIERHFLVSAPSVNQMMQTLERRGFIARQQGVPRSIRICLELPKNVQHGARNQ